MRKTALLFGLILLTLPQQVFAEDGDLSGITPNPNKTYTMQQDAMDSKKGNKQERTMAMMEKKGNIADTVKENRAARQAEFQQKKAAFKEQLQTLKDENKKQIAEVLDTKLDTINKNRTDRMTANLTRLSEILSRLEAKKIEAQTNGKDVSAINTAIVAAETAITTAETAVAAQSAKDYTAQVTSEASLRENFRTVLAQLKTDLETTHKTVANAKESVKTVAKAIALVQEPVETVSPTP